jgi:hypothetical protein
MANRSSTVVVALRSIARPSSLSLPSLAGHEAREAARALLACSADMPLEFSIVVGRSLCGRHGAGFAIEVGFGVASARAASTLAA